MAKNQKTTVKRVPKRGAYDTETIYAILDRSYYCNVGFIHEGYPVVIPTAYGRYSDEIYLHGSMASRMMKNLAEGLDVCVTVTNLTGLVLAKSAFHHSMNYESVVIFGRAVMLNSDEDKMKGLKAFTDHALPHRWEECRLPNDKELKGTMVLKLSLENASAKIRDEGASDDKADESLSIWTGVLPIQTNIGKPIFIENNDGIQIPKSVKALIIQ